MKKNSCFIYSDMSWFAVSNGYFIKQITSWLSIMYESNSPPGLTIIKKRQVTYIEDLEVAPYGLQIMMSIKQGLIMNMNTKFMNILFIHMCVCACTHAPVHHAIISSIVNIQTGV